MKIVLFGYGKMGKEIEKIAISRGHQIVLKIDNKNVNEISEADLNKGDVAIEFTVPSAAYENAVKCFKSKIPVVIGTTGWYDQLESLSQTCLSYKGAMLYATNFSIGVNILFYINQILAKVMDKQNNYEPEIEEYHHQEKLDAPSGTALSLADDMIHEIVRKKKWKGYMKADAIDTINSEELKVISGRERDIKGIHTVRYVSETDEIMIRHEAYNRQGFALGSVIAAEWLKDKTGVYTMKDVLKLR